ncbi:MAG: hypothetical protein RRC34_04130 [Lentisphaeria bacterium]|nr:hypothetical protein [Lentisphaeria bacterium]
MPRCFIFGTMALTCLLVNGTLHAAGTGAGEADRKPAGGLRLAVVSLEGGAPVPAIFSDLLLVELNDKTDLHLLERQEVTRVLAEQELSLMTRGAVDADSAIQAGKILAADAILILENENHSEKPLLRTRLVDARYGLKLFDGSLALPENPDGYETITDQVAGRAIRHLRRVNVPPDQLLMVGVSSFRNDDLSNKWDWLSDEIPRVIEQNLALYPGVALLERKATAPLSEERDIASGLPEALQTSAVILNGSFRLSNGGKSVSVHVEARRGNAVVGEETFATPLDGVGAGCMAAAKTLLEKLREVGTGAPMDALEEAEILAAEACAYINRHEANRGLPAAEAALALVPDSFDYMELVITSIIGSGGVLDNGRRDVEDPRLLLPYHRRAAWLARKILLTCPVPPYPITTVEEKRQGTLHVVAPGYASKALTPLYHVRKHPGYYDGGRTDVLYEELWELFEAARARYAGRPRRLAGLIFHFSSNNGAHAIQRAGSIEEAIRRTDELVKLELETFHALPRTRGNIPLYALQDFYGALCTFWKEDKAAGTKGLAYLTELQNSEDSSLRSQALKYGLYFYKSIVPNHDKRQELAAAYVEAAKEAAWPDLGPVLNGQYDEDEAESERIKLRFVQEILDHAFENGYAGDSFDGLGSGSRLLAEDLERHGKPEEALNYLQRMADIYKPRKYDRWQTMVDAMDKLKARHPNLAGADKNRKVAGVKLLLRADGIALPGHDGKINFCRFVPADDQVIIMVFPSAPTVTSDAYGAIRVDPETSHVSLVAPITPLRHPEWKSPGRVFSWYPRVTLTGDELHMGCEGTGVTTIGADGSVTRLHMDNGLTFNGVGGIAQLGDWLFSITGVEYSPLQAVVGINRKTGEKRVICSSREIRPSDKAKLLVPGIVADPERNCLWFITVGIGTESVRPSASRDLYRYDPETDHREIIPAAEEGLRRIGLRATPPATGELMRVSGDNLVISGVTGICSFNIETEQSQVAGVRDPGNGEQWDHPGTFFYGSSFFRVTDGLAGISEDRLIHFQSGKREPRIYPVTSFILSAGEGQIRNRNNGWQSGDFYNGAVLDLLATDKGLYVLTRDALWLVPEIKTAEDSLQVKEGL